MTAIGGFLSIDGTWMTHRVRKTILRVEPSRALFEHIQGEKFAAVAPLPYTSLLRNCKLVHQWRNFSGSDCIIGATIKCSVPEGWIRANIILSYPLISLIDPNIADEPNAVKTNTTTPSTSPISVRIMAGHAADELFPVRSTRTRPLPPGHPAQGGLELCGGA
ncbi:hypothetical protein MRX96_057922 [Rhipicephalus microplus]